MNLNTLTVSAEAPLDATNAVDSMSTSGFIQAACKLKPVFAPTVYDYEVLVPLSALRVRLNGMSYTAGGIKIQGKIGNMRLVELNKEGITDVELTLHNHDGELGQTYTFHVSKVDMVADADHMMTVNIPAPPPIPGPPAHGHSHGDGTICTHDHGADSVSHGHSHGDGKVCTEKHEHGHSHGDGKVCTEKHEHGHSHGDSKVCTEKHEHGHSHGDSKTCTQSHGHDHADHHEKNHHGHGHGHGHDHK
mmetsp:Transcript_31300/g.60370  ORF Transcript_31300/g.60370 Transcript_31300/m.60370 type:complete len:247 (-) Transcript_31300:280-1020(-)